MTNTVAIVNFSNPALEKSAPVRTIAMGEDIWFAAIDVCRALDLKVGSSGAAPYTGRLEPQEKLIVSRTDESTLDLFKGTKGGNSLMLISESGLYKLTLRSDKPEAVEFQNWITGEVLPAIRKTGSYSLEECGREQMPLPTELNEALARAVIGIEKTLAAMVAYLAANPAQGPDRMVTARQIKSFGIGGDLSVAEIGYALTEYSYRNGYKVTTEQKKGPYGKVNSYSLYAAKACFTNP